jgi:succinylglutamate desuccinylase
MLHYICGLGVETKKPENKSQATQMDNSRVIGKYDVGNKGPLIICIGATHGNEPAGVRAIELVLKMLDVEHIKNHDFTYQGRFVGIIGNLKAYDQKKRFLSKDMNRQFYLENIEALINKKDIEEEDEEVMGVIQFINDEIKDYQPEQVVILDLHTTSSFGGIFTICNNCPEQIEVALGLHAPVVLGIAEGLVGTTLHYFNSNNLGVDTTCISFESGQHNESKSVNRAVAGVICMLREVGAVRHDDVENLHEIILQSYADGLPKLTKLVDHFRIGPDDQFKMKLGYKNFQKITRGELLATLNGEDIFASQDGMILMPLYQDQGEDGFFIVQEIKV